MTWVTGAVIFILVMAMSLTGYLLVCDQRAYWATVVGRQHQRHGADRRALPREVPEGRARSSASRRSRASTRCTCWSSRAGSARFIVAAPVARRPPRRHVAALVEAPGEGRMTSDAALDGTRAPRAGTCASTHYQKKTGKPFFPYAILHDTIASLFFVAAHHRPGDRLARRVRPDPGRADRRAPRRHPRRRSTRRRPTPASRSTTRGRSGTSSSSSSCCASSRRRELLLFATIIIPTIWMVLLIALAVPRPPARAPRLAPADRHGHRRLGADRCCWR